MLLAAERYDGGDPVNLGTDEEMPIKDLVAIIRELVGFDGEIRWDTSKPDGQPRRRVDPSRAREGVRVPRRRWTSAKGCRRTIDWYRANREARRVPHPLTAARPRPAGSPRRTAGPGATWAAPVAGSPSGRLAAFSGSVGTMPGGAPSASAACMKAGSSSAGRVCSWSRPPARRDRWPRRPRSRAPVVGRGLERPTGACAARPAAPPRAPAGRERRRSPRAPTAPAGDRRCPRRTRAAGCRPGRWPASGRRRSRRRRR